MVENQSKTLWVGDLEPWMDEKLLINIFDTSYSIINLTNSNNPKYQNNPR
jgi:hypothetical protein